MARWGLGQVEITLALFPWASSGCPFSSCAISPVLLFAMTHWMWRTRSCTCQKHVLSVMTGWVGYGWLLASQRTNIYLHTAFLRWINCRTSSLPPLTRNTSGVVYGDGGVESCSYIYTTKLHLTHSGAEIEVQQCCNATRLNCI